MKISTLEDLKCCKIEKTHTYTLAGVTQLVKASSCRLKGLQLTSSQAYSWVEPLVPHHYTCKKQLIKVSLPLSLFPLSLSKNKQTNKINSLVHMNLKEKNEYIHTLIHSGNINNKN